MLTPRDKKRGDKNFCRDNKSYDLSMKMTFFCPSDHLYSLRFITSNYIYVGEKAAIFHQSVEFL